MTSPSVYRAARSGTSESSRSRLSAKCAIDAIIASDASGNSLWSTGNTILRRRLRRKSHSAFVESVTYLSLRSPRYFRISALDVQRSGRTTKPLRGRMPPRPCTDERRSRFKKKVSSWSSRWWPTATACARRLSTIVSNHS